MFNSSNLRRWITPLVIGAFLVTALTGVMMFFHLRTGVVKITHEWMAISFVGLGLLHAWTNWAAVKHHFKRWQTPALIFSVMLLAGLLLFETANQSSARVGIMRQLQTAPLSAIAAVQQVPSEHLILRLKQQGLEVTDDDPSLIQLADDNRVSTQTMLAAVFGEDASSLRGRHPQRD